VGSEPGIGARLQAVEAALRVRFSAGNGATFFNLIDRAKAEGLVTDEVHEILHVGRRLRNDQGRSRREQVRLQAAEMFADDADARQVARSLRVSTKSVYQWRRT